jgi:hypothetical protein
VSGGEIQFLNLEDVLILHEMQIERYGGATGIRDQGLLESAIGMPQASFGGEFMHKGLFEMAAASSLSKLRNNSPAIDANQGGFSLKPVPIISRIISFARMIIESGRTTPAGAVLRIATIQF